MQQSKVSEAVLRISSLFTLESLMNAGTIQVREDLALGGDEKDGEKSDKTSAHKFNSSPFTLESLINAGTNSGREELAI